MAELFVIEAKEQIQAQKLRVCAYARVSTEQENQENSFEAQIAYYRQMILQHPNWVLVDIYADKGITGTSAAKRPGFQQMMQDCQNNEIDCILVKSVSRFARNVMECLYYIRALKQWGVTVIFEKEQLNTANLDNEFLLTFFGCLSEEEAKSISQNVRWSVYNRMKQGKFITTYAPYGYRLEGGGLVVDQTESLVVKWIYERFLNGDSYAQIADTLNLHGVAKGKSTVGWTESGIQCILSNEKYIGDALVQKTFTTNTIPFRRMVNKGQREMFYIENAQEAIIDPADAQKVKELLALRNTGNREREKRPLSGKIYCGACGTKMRSKINRGKAYWACQVHEREKQSCSVVEVEESRIYDAFEKLYGQLQSYYKPILTPALQQLESLTPNNTDQHFEQNAEVMNIQKQIQMLNRLMSRQHIESAFYMEKSRQLQDELRRIEAQLFQRSMKQTKQIYQIKKLMQAIITGDGLLEQQMNRMVEKIEIQNDRKIVFHLKGGFQFEEQLER